MRQGEILGLRWEHTDFDQKTIYVAFTKTGRPRRIPMSKPVEVQLRSLSKMPCKTNMFSVTPVQV